MQHVRRASGASMGAPLRWGLCALKGGCGRSSVAWLLATEGTQRGLKVLCVDADPQASLRTATDIALQAGHPAPTTIALTGETLHHPSQLPRISAGYDLVLVDGVPRMSEVLRSILMFVDVALVPSSGAPTETWAAGQAVDLIRQAQGVRPSLKCALLLNKIQPNTGIGRAARSALETTGMPVLRTVLAWRVAFQEVMASGQGLCDYAPSSPADLEVRKLFTELLALSRGENLEPKTARHQPTSGAAARGA